MRFTWWTYMVSLHRARKAEALEFRQHYAAFRGPHEWMTRWEFTDALKRRRKRERGKVKSN